MFIVDMSCCYVIRASQLDSPVMIRSPVKTTVEDPIAIEMRKRLDDEIDFRKGPWMSMLHSLQLPPYALAGTGLSPHLISFHFISFHFISFHFISFHFISSHLSSSHHITSHHITSHLISSN
jgi:hypothetical protein